MSQLFRLLSFFSNVLASLQGVHWILPLLLGISQCFLLAPCRAGGALRLATKTLPRRESAQITTEETAPLICMVIGETCTYHLHLDRP